MKQAIFAGSFDPIHCGHLSIIKKALKIVDHLLVVVANNPEKKSSPLPKRLAAVTKKLSTNPRVTVRSMPTGLIAEFAREAQIDILIRSARNSADFDFELMMAIQNKRINHAIETVLLLPDQSNIKIRGSIIPKAM